MKRWSFVECKDGDGKLVGTNPSVTFMLDKPTTLIGYYEEVVETGSVFFDGIVSAQEKEGEIVTITITKPDSTTEQVTTPTKVDLTFGPLEYSGVPGDYKAKARVEADALYEAAESEEVMFSIGKLPRTITLLVTPSASARLQHK